MKDEPQVSICIPSYREPGFVEAAIKSCLTQDYDDFEVVVSDDTPDDTVAQVVQGLAREDARVRYFRNPGPHGAAANSNHAARQARGAWLKFLHHDDAFATAGALALFMEHRLQADVVFAPCFWERGGVQGVYRIAPEAYADLRNDPVGALIRRGNVVGAPSAVLVRREKFLPFEQDMNWLFDLFWYLQMGQAGASFYCLEQPVILINQHDRQLTERVGGDPMVHLQESLSMAASLTLCGAHRALMRQQVAAMVRTTAHQMDWLPFGRLLLRNHYRPLLVAASFLAGKASAVTRRLPFW